MKKLYVAILWHMHQPPYRDPESSEPLLPWVRLHALREYHDMARVLDRDDRMRCTFNFVPSLLQQLDEIAHGGVVDRYAAVTRKPTSALTVPERRFVAQELFSVHRESNILPYPRYRELLSLREVAPAQADPADWFQEAELRDLQVWYDLAWSGEELREDPVVRDLIEKGRGFTERDKARLAERHQELLGRILPFYARLAAEQRIELSASAFYHPILPLLIDTDAATEADGATPLPREVFRFPGDAELQVQRGLDAFERHFGARPAGMWPPEGSVSTEAVSMLGRNGVRWVATDEAILRKSLGAPFRADELCRPWRHGGVNLFFRDHGLSDRIGFVYAQWPIERAVDDFAQHLDAILKATTIPYPVVTIALDGENAWEHYREGGMNFLASLYDRLCDEPHLEPITFSAYLDRHGDQVADLPSLRAGSWIDGNFRTWIGDPSKNKAWDYLARTRRAAEAVMANGDLTAETRAELLDVLLRAEASDWFWWLGEGHSSAHDWEFEQLFLRLLKRAWRLAGLTPPAELDRGIEQVRPREMQQAPSRLLSPKITGKLDGFFKWHQAGRHDFQQGSIHRQESRMRCIHYGFDDHNVYVRIDFDESARRVLASSARLELRFVAPRPVTLRFVPGEAAHLRAESTEGAPVVAVEAAGDRIFEARIPVAMLVGEPAPPGPLVLEFFASLRHGVEEVERLPLANNLRFEHNPRELELQSWFV
ncbi:MAG: hypothetical protein AMXMBFR64_45300 [Myxococcales bacterium]